MKRIKWSQRQSSTIQPEWTCLEILCLHQQIFILGVLDVSHVQQMLLDICIFNISYFLSSFIAYQWKFVFRYNLIPLLFLVITVIGSIIYTSKVNLLYSQWCVRIHPTIQGYWASFESQPQNWSGKVFPQKIRIEPKFRLLSCFEPEEKPLDMIIIMICLS